MPRPRPLLIWASASGTSDDVIAAAATAASRSALARETRNRADGREEHRPAQTDWAEETGQSSERRVQQRERKKKEMKT